MPADQFPGRPRFRRIGFTLIEILVVLAIMAILTAILLPVISQVRERGRQVQCTNVLKQFGTAFIMYSQDYDERFPNPGGRGMQASPGHAAVSVGGNGAVWYTTGFTVDSSGFDPGGLQSYMQSGDKMGGHWTCGNAYKPLLSSIFGGVSNSYSMNDYLRHGHPGQAFTAVGDVPGAFNPSFHTGASSAQLGENATQLILVYEAVQSSGGTANRNGSPYFTVSASRYGSGDLPQGAPEEYHQGRSNFLFCDGHVKALKPTQTWTSATQAKIQTFNPDYAAARGGRAGEGQVDMWDPKIAGVAYP